MSHAGDWVFSAGVNCRWEALHSGRLFDSLGWPHFRRRIESVLSDRESVCLKK